MSEFVVLVQIPKRDKVFRWLFIEYQDKVVRVTLKNPSWLANLQTSAPLGGYLMENGEFFATLPKDGRKTEGLKVTLEVASS